jgi:hypothetical protein
MTPRARLLVTGLLVVGSLAAFLRGQPFWGVAVVVFAALTALPLIGTADLQRAGSAFNAHDREKAWTHLQSVPFRGRLLGRKGRTYYHHLRSLCLQKLERWPDAASEAEAAVRVAGRREEAPGCHLAAATAYAHLGEVDAARRHAEAARQLPHNDAVTKGLARLDRLLTEPV